MRVNPPTIFTSGGNYRSPEKKIVNFLGDDQKNLCVKKIAVRLLRGEGFWSAGVAECGGCRRWGLQIEGLRRISFIACEGSGVWGLGV